MKRAISLFFLLYSIIGFVASLILHLSLYTGSDLSTSLSRPWIFMHFAIVGGWVGLLILRKFSVVPPATYGQTAESTFLQIGTILFCLFLFFELFNFMYYEERVLRERYPDIIDGQYVMAGYHGAKPRKVTEQEYRQGVIYQARKTSSHWMICHLIPCLLLYDDYRWRRLGKPKLSQGKSDISKLRHQTQILKYKMAVAGLRQVEEPLKLAHAVRHLGDSYRRAGDAALAEPCYDEALSIYRSREDRNPLDLANAIRGYALLKQQTGDLGEAEERWIEAHNLYKSTNVMSGVAGSAARLALLTHERSKVDDCKEWLSIAIKTADLTDDPEVVQHVNEVRVQLEPTLTS
jgi:tetratricopeptide (TPR) repeat protein